MRIAVVGTGYVGLVSGTCLAETGVTVTCVDVDASKIDKLNQGGIPIYEPGLAELVIKNRANERLFFTTSLKEALVDADAVFIAVGTPPDEDGSADLSYVIGVAHEIGCLIEEYVVVVTKSTVPVGTNRKVKLAVQEELDKRGVEVVFDVASNPEFLKEGPFFRSLYHFPFIFSFSERNSLPHGIVTVNGYPNPKEVISCPENMRTGSVSCI